MTRSKHRVGWGYTLWNRNGFLGSFKLSAGGAADSPSTIATHTLSIMNTLEIKGDWSIIKGKLKQKWSDLTDDDLLYLEGQSDELMGRIQKRTGQTREAIQESIEVFRKDNQ